MSIINLPVNMHDSSLGLTLHIMCNRTDILPPSTCENKIKFFDRNSSKQIKCKQHKHIEAMLVKETCMPGTAATQLANTFSIQ